MLMPHRPFGSLPHIGILADFIYVGGLSGRARGFIYLSLLSGAQYGHFFFWCYGGLLESFKITF